MTMKTLIGAASLAPVTSTSALFADNKDTVTIFYALLSNPGDAAQTEAFKAATSENW